MSRSFTTIYRNIASDLPTPVYLCEAYNPVNSKDAAPGMYKFKAIWDTGAQKSVITEEVAKK